MSKFDRTPLEEAKEFLQTANAACVVIRNGERFAFQEKGIAPLLSGFQKSEHFFENAVVGDKVVGKAAALLLVKGKVCAVYADVLSEHAKRILDTHQIEYAYKTLVPHIINRSGDGICPMEEAVLQEENPVRAHKVLVERLQLRGDYTPPRS